MALLLTFVVHSGLQLMANSQQLFHHPLDVDFQMLDGSVLHRQRNAGGAMEATSGGAGEQFGELLLRL